MCDFRLLKQISDRGEDRADRKLQVIYETDAGTHSWEDIGTIFGKLQKLRNVELCKRRDLWK